MKKQASHAETERFEAQGNLQEEREEEQEAADENSESENKQSSQDEFARVKDMQDQLAQ